MKKAILIITALITLQSCNTETPLKNTDTFTPFQKEWLKNQDDPAFIASRINKLDKVKYAKFLEALNLRLDMSKEFINLVDAMNKQYKGTGVKFQNSYK